MWVYNLNYLQQFFSVIFFFIFIFLTQIYVTSMQQYNNSFVNIHFYTVAFFSTIAVDLSWPLLVCFFFGNLMISISLAMVAMLVVETPFVKLEKLILGRLLAPKQVENGKKPV